MRVLFDTNVLVRMLLPSDNPFRSVSVALRAALGQLFEVLVPAALQAEFLDCIAKKPFLARSIAPRVAHGLVSELEEVGVRLPVLMGPHPPVSRDAKDNYLVAYAMSGRADYLVTDDGDLLVLDGQFSFRIVTPGDFVGVLRERGLV